MVRKLPPSWATRLQLVVYTVLLGLGIFAIIYANQTSTQADTASNQARIGAAACQTQIDSYAGSKAFRLAVRSEMRTSSIIRSKTAKVFEQLANLSPSASVAQTQILNLALAYERSAAKSLALANGIAIPTRPDCQKAS